MPPYLHDREAGEGEEPVLHDQERVVFVLHGEDALRREEHTKKGELRADETEFDVRVRLLGVPPGSEVPGIRGRRRGGGRGGGTTGRETGREKGGEKGGETVRYNDDSRIEYKIGYYMSPTSTHSCTHTHCLHVWVRLFTYFPSSFFSPFLLSRST